MGLPLPAAAPRTITLLTAVDAEEVCSYTANVLICKLAPIRAVERHAVATVLLWVHTFAPAA